MLHICLRISEYKCKQEAVQVETELQVQVNLSSITLNILKNAIYHLLIGKLSKTETMNNALILFVRQSETKNKQRE